MHQRYAKASTVYFDNNLVKTVDLSMGGLKIKSSKKVASRDPISICITLEDDFILVSGVIVWGNVTRQLDYSYGIKFNRISDNDIKQLHAYLS